MNTLEIYKNWLGFISDVKNQIKALGYKEVISPTLVDSPAMEAYLDGFKIEGYDLYLPTSPEFGLKKIWLSGDPELSKIFEVSKSFRANEENTRHHLPEFTMLEFYNDELSFDEFVEQVSSLCMNLIGFNKTSKAIHVSLPEVFYSLTGFKLTPESNSADLQSLCKKLKVSCAKSDSLNDLFQRIYLEIIEPSLSKKDFVILKDFPPFLSALSKISAEGWAQRFECYFDGVELSNGYNELLDASLIEKRWGDENNIRLSLGLKPHPLDKNLINMHKKTKIQSGVGVAVGLERLFLLKEKLLGFSITMADTKGLL